MASSLLSPPPPRPPPLISHRSSPSSLSRSLRLHASNNGNNNRSASFTDQILDYIEGGPKLRRWYGAPDLLPKDGAADVDEDSTPEDDADREAVLVTNGDSEIGQMVILSLILKRAQIKAIVKDKRAALDAFGTYIEPVVADGSGKLSSTKALRGVRAMICPTNEGFLSNVGVMKGVQHVVLLSQLAVYRSSNAIQALMNNKARKLAERDEEFIIASGIPYTIIRCGVLKDSPGGLEGFSFKQGVASQGKLSKEDAARICVEALDVIPQSGLIFEVANGDEKVSDWKLLLTSLVKNEEQLK